MIPLYDETARTVQHSVRPVTFCEKRYIFVCVGCSRLAESQRPDTLTCTTACRVRAHRSGTTRKLRAEAASSEVKPSTLLHAQAVEELRPDLGDRIMPGESPIEDAMPVVSA